jgi:hypothetical protein
MSCVGRVPQDHSTRSGRGTRSAAQKAWDPTRTPGESGRGRTATKEKGTLAGAPFWNPLQACCKRTV